ncbi:MAG TPA: AsmA family protein [Opitutaceae bacterium]|nr:AsmA family protein [Opitutaceae bacterium]
MKVFLSIVGVIVALLVIGFFILAFSLGSIVKKGVNAKGPEITQSSVVLGGAKISPFSGKGTLSDLVIGNPAGWTSDHAFSLGQIAIDVEPKSLRGDHVIVNSIAIEKPDIIYETRITSSNLQDLLKNIQQATGSSGESKTSEGKPVKIELRDFTLNDATITVVAGDRKQSVKMPAIHLQNLGTNEGGLTPQQLSVAIVKEITTQAVQAAAQVAIDSGLLDKAGAKATEGLRKLLGGEKSKDTSSAPAPSSTPAPANP